jgi:hypothetical protein
MNTTVYQVRDWNKRHENDRSRRIAECRWFSMNNNFATVSMQYLLSLPDGAAILGVYVILCALVSQQIKGEGEARDGWLTVNGISKGRPWTPKELALTFRRPEEEISRALQILSSESVGLLIAHAHHPLTTDSPSAHHQITPRSPDGHLEGRKEGRKVGKKEVCGEQQTLIGEDETLKGPLPQLLQKLHEGPRKLLEQFVNDDLIEISGDQVVIRTPEKIAEATRSTIENGLFAAGYTAKFFLQKGA